MGQYLTRLFFSFLIGIVFAISLAFILIRFLPGGPLDSETHMPLEVKESLASYYHLNLPLHEQYFIYLKNILSFNFGESIYFQGQSVLRVIGDYYNPTLQLAFYAGVFYIISGILLGTVSSLFYQKTLDHLIVGGVNLCLALPSLFWGPLLIYIFSLKLGVLPAALLNSSVHFILPVLVLSLKPMAALTLLCRSKMLSVLKENFIKTAYAKGLSRSAVFFKHALKNSSSFILSVLSPQLALLFSGAMVVEALFSISGLGQLFVLAVNERDYPLILGMTLLSTFIIMLFNFLTRFLSACIDPRLAEVNE